MNNLIKENFELVQNTFLLKNMSNEDNFTTNAREYDLRGLQRSKKIFEVMKYFKSNDNSSRYLNFKLIDYFNIDVIDWDINFNSTKDGYYYLHAVKFLIQFNEGSTHMFDGSLKKLSEMFQIDKDVYRLLNRKLSEKEVDSGSLLLTVSMLINEILTSIQLSNFFSTIYNMRKELINVDGDKITIKECGNLLTIQYCPYTDNTMYTLHFKDSIDSIDFKNEFVKQKTIEDVFTYMNTRKQLRLLTFKEEVGFLKLINLYNYQTNPLNNVKRYFKAGSDSLIFNNGHITINFYINRVRVNVHDKTIFIKLENDCDYNEVLFKNIAEFIAE